MITGDLGTELVKVMRQLSADGALPPAAAELPQAGTWRPAPDGDPASFATSLPFRIARLDGSAAADVATVLARPLRTVPWIRKVRPAGPGYLTITVIPAALAAVAGRIAAAGPSCAQSAALSGTATTVMPWPDLAAARSWPRAWQEQADAMTRQLSRAAGADAASGGERGSRSDSVSATHSRVGAAVAWFGDSAVRYCVARARPGSVSQLAWQLRPGYRMPAALTDVQVALADAAATQRWAADLGIDRADDTDDVALDLTGPAELRLLSQLSWLPEKVASAARRSRPDELPRYLEQVAVAWVTCKQDSPALPFGGLAATRDPVVAGARLLLADATRIVLATGLVLTGITPADQLARDHSS